MVAGIIMTGRRFEIMATDNYVMTGRRFENMATDIFPICSKL